MFAVNCFLHFLLIYSVLSAEEILGISESVESCSFKDRSFCDKLSQKCLSIKRYSTDKKTSHCIGEYGSVTNINSHEIHPAPTNVTRCDTVGYKNLTCQNNGTCYAVEMGVTWTYTCLCEDAYSGKTCQFRGRLIQDFMLSPKEIVSSPTVVGDADNIYTVSGRTLISYQKSSNGGITGSGFASSVNSTVQLDRQSSNIDQTALNDLNMFAYVDDIVADPKIRVAYVNPLSPANVTVSPGQSPGAVALDAYGYVWLNIDGLVVSTNIPVFSGVSGKLAGNFTKSGIAGQKGSFGFGAVISSDDYLYMADSTMGVAIYKIQRNAGDNSPEGVTFAKSFPLPECSSLGPGLGQMVFDRWGQLLVVCQTYVAVVQPDGTVGQINGVKVTETQPWWSIWCDPESGYLFQTTCCTNHIYVQQYMVY